MHPVVKRRGGFMLFGEDVEQNPFTWYIGSAADDFLRWGAHSPAPESPEIGSEDD